MTKEKLQLFKDMYLKEVKHTIDPNRKATRGEYIRIVLDSGIEFNTQTDFVIFDDDNELLHIICANDDPLSQYDWPFKIMSAPYDIIFVIESIMSKTNLDDILNDSFLGNVINDEKKKFIRTWMDSSNTLHKPYPMDADPYYTQNPKSIPNGTKIISRDDGIKIASSPATKSSGVVKAVKTKESFLDAIANAESGAIVALASNIELKETLKLEKPITIHGCGKTITSSAPKAIEVYADATIKDITINNSCANGRCVDTRKAVNLELDGVELITTSASNNQTITIGGSDSGTNVIIKNSEISAGDAGYGLICFVESEINIEDTNINGYGGIYMKAGSEGSKINVKNSIIEGKNEHTGDDDRFGTIIFEAGNIEVSVDKYSTISSYPENDAKHTAFLLNSNEIDNIVIGVDGAINGIPLYINEGTSILNNIFITSEKYKEAFWSSGFVTTKSSAGYIKIADKSNTTLVNGVACETIADAIAAANVGDTVYICSDITSSDIIKVDKAITIDGGGKVVTGSAKKTFEIYADATITNMTIDNTSSSGRCVDTRSAVHVELDNVTMNTSSNQNNQPITIGGSENGTTLVLKNSNISAGVAGYGVIAFVKSDVTLENSKIDAYSAVYMKEGSDESYVEIANCDIVCKNPHLDPSSHFGVIAIESNNCSINVVGNTTISAEPVEGQMHEIVLLINTADKNSIIFESDATLNGDILNASETIAENNIKLSTSYTDKIVENGFDYEEIDGDYIMIKS